MVMRANVWPAEREQVIARVAPAFASSCSFDEAADRLGVSRASLQGVLRAHRIEWKPMLKGASVAPVSSPEPEPLPAVDWTGARPQTTGAGLERRVLLGDLHIPYHDLRACAAALAVIRAVQPHRIIQLGDYWNMGAVSHHPRPFGGPENHDQALRQGVAFAEAMRRAAPGAEITILLGNHDTWADEYEDAHPEFAGLMAARHLGLERLGVKVVPRHAQPIVIGPVAYTHGYGGGEHSAKKYAIEVAPAVGVRYVKAAHHHVVQRHHARNGCEAWTVGSLVKRTAPAFDYAKNRDHWELALCIEDVMGDRVSTSPVRLDGGAALFGGRLIAA
jgi:hypothetical protein